VFRSQWFLNGRIRLRTITATSIAVTEGWATNAAPPPGPRAGAVARHRRALYAYVFMLGRTLRRGGRWAIPIGIGLNYPDNPLTTS